MATERYLLGEMTGAELDEFEEHMFVCGECAAAVTRGAVFTENARAVFHEHPNLLQAHGREKKRENSSRLISLFWNWFSFPQLATGTAALALACFVGFQYRENARLQGDIASLIAQPLQKEITLAPASRGSGEHAQTVPADVASFGVELQELPEKCSGGCTVRVRDSQGRFVRGVNVPLSYALNGKAPLHLTRALMGPGTYTIVVKTNGSAAQEEKDYSVQLE